MAAKNMKSKYTMDLPKFVKTADNATFSRHVADEITPDVCEAAESREHQQSMELRKDLQEVKQVVQSLKREMIVQDSIDGVITWLDKRNRREEGRVSTIEKAVAEIGDNLVKSIASSSEYMRTKFARIEQFMESMERRMDTIEKRLESQEEVMKFQYTLSSTTVKEGNTLESRCSDNHHWTPIDPNCTSQPMKPVDTFMTMNVDTEQLQFAEEDFNTPAVRKRLFSSQLGPDSCEPAGLRRS